MISISSSGYCADVISFRDWASTTETFIEEVPMSIPNNSIIAIINPLQIKIRKDERIHPSFSIAI
jgi:hypothetical protein